MKLSQILKGIEYELLQGSDAIEIKNLSWDSRQVSPESLFICVKNRNVDRHEFAAAAYDKGAIAFIVETEINIPATDAAIIKVKNTHLALAEAASNFLGNPAAKLELIGITGTNGKTSVAYYIKKILEKHQHKVGIIGTIENKLGETLLTTKKINPTTPDALELQESFKEMYEGGAAKVVMEVTSAALALDRVHGCHFKTAVFTNLTQDHLDEHSTMENYKQAKLRLFNLCENAVINIDDEMAIDILRSSKANKLTYGIKGNADIMAKDICYNTHSTDFTLCLKGQERRLTLNIPGEFSVYNALAAAGACLSSSLSLEQIVEGLEAIDGVNGRFEVLSSIKDYKVILDYAHSPDALKNVLNTARQVTTGNLITVFGCGGNRDRTKRPIMGEIAGRLSDLCIITSDNPRNETPEKIISEVEVGVKNTICRYEKIENRKLAIYRALSIAKKGDTIVIAGKGHETYQIYGDTTIHFDDREIVENYIKEEF